jgi:hypothetical protein
MEAEEVPPPGVEEPANVAAAADIAPTGESPQELGPGWRVYEVIALSIMGIGLIYGLCMIAIPAGMYAAAKGAHPELSREPVSTGLLVIHVMWMIAFIGFGASFFCLGCGCESMWPSIVVGIVWLAMWIAYWVLSFTNSQYKLAGTLEGMSKGEWDALWQTIVTTPPVLDMWAFGHWIDKITRRVDDSVICGSETLTLEGGSAVDNSTGGEFDFGASGAYILRPSLTVDWTPEAAVVRRATAVTWKGFAERVGFDSRVEWDVMSSPYMEELDNGLIVVTESGKIPVGARRGSGVGLGIFGGGAAYAYNVARLLPVLLPAVNKVEATLVAPSLEYDEMAFSCWDSYEDPPPGFSWCSDADCFWVPG